MTATYPKISPTADPRIRIACYEPRNFRTQVQDEPGADWSITGPVYLTRAEALLMVDETVSRHFGEPTHNRIRSLVAQVERLTAERDALQAKVYEGKRHNGALSVDGDRREQRALALLPDCEAHRRELQYLRHCVSWYWHCMNDSDQARQAIVAQLQLTALRMRELGNSSLNASDMADRLEKAVDAQNKPLKRHSFPTLADCLRSAHGDCDHDTIADEVKAEIARALGLAMSSSQTLPSCLKGPLPHPEQHS